MKKKLHKDTIATRAGIETDHQHKAIVPPIYLINKFCYFKKLDKINLMNIHEQGNPTRDHLIHTLSAN
jgi:O-acetylhomoserine/O-acetylserine sulfhydrylase-like pyridoxal-dependent enzyme